MQRDKSQAATERYPPVNPVDLDALADTTCTLVEGGMILGRVLQDTTVVPRQVLLFRDFVRLVFTAPG